MDPELAVHTLLRIEGPESLLTSQAPEAWAVDALRTAPWVVVRRAESRRHAVPVGVRGAGRSQRYAAWLDGDAVLETLTPECLAQARGWLRSDRRDTVPAIGALDEVEAIMCDCGLSDSWGPVGSVGFELASANPTATATSDLDLAVRADRSLSVAAARALAAALDGLAVRTDTLLETPCGAVSLSEYARSDGSVLLRTRQGPRLVADCWHADAAPAVG
jgi:phosphoribosyl-dephospho-CoA transferase